MRKQLGDTDRKAVDLVLNHQPMESQNSHHPSVPLQSPRDAGHSQALFIPLANADLQQHVRGVERILRLLQAMPSDEPSGDLLKRTLDRIKQQGSTDPDLRTAPSPTLIEEQTHG
jgi:hypothetical protein